MKINKTIIYVIILVLISTILALIYLALNTNRYIDNINRNIENKFLFVYLPKYLRVIGGNTNIKDGTGNIIKKTSNILKKNTKIFKYNADGLFLKPQLSEPIMNMWGINLCNTTGLCIIANNNNKEIYIVYPLYRYNTFFISTDNIEIVCKIDYIGITNLVNFNSFKKYSYYKRIRDLVKQNHIKCIVYKPDTNFLRPLYKSNILDILNN